VLNANKFYEFALIYTYSAINMLSQAKSGLIFFSGFPDDSQTSAYVPDQLFNSLEAEVTFVTWDLNNYILGWVSL
jgi:hypothetical protein